MYVLIVLETFQQASERRQSEMFSMFNANIGIYYQMPGYATLAAGVGVADRVVQRRWSEKQVCVSADYWA